MKPAKFLPMRQRAIGLNLVAVHPMRAQIGNVKQRLVGRKRDTVGVFEVGLNGFSFAVGLDKPDFARFERIWKRICNVHIAVVCHHHIVPCKAFGGGVHFAAAVIVKEHLTLGVSGESFGKLGALAHQLPALVFYQNIV